MRRAVAAAAAITLAITTMAPAAHADDDDDRGGDRPLPGYTIDNPPLAPLDVAGRPTEVLQGVHAHAAFDIEVPPHWNGDLVMYAHGFRGNTTVLTVEPPPYELREKLVREGYAWAASSYYDNGYDVRAGVLSTHDLAEHFADLFDEPHRTYLFGVSMGGHVTGRSIEEFPRFYDGALPVCGVLGGSAIFDYIDDVNLVAQAMAGVPDYPATAGYMTTKVPAITSALGIAGLPFGGSPTNDLGRQYRSIVTNRSGGPRPGADNAFSLWFSILFPFTLWGPDDGGTLAANPGRLATNVDTVYTPNAPFDVNASVVRVAPVDAAARASRALTVSPQIAGKPRVPVLSLHDLGDLFVPFSMEQIYAANVARNHRSSMVVQRAIRAVAHCEFSPNEVGQAFDDLVAWVTHGVRPAGDDVRDPATVAAPDYGCAFTDKSAYVTGSRPFYAPCP